MGARSAFRRLGIRAFSTQPASSFEAVFISGQGLHWEDIDEDVSIDGLLAGGGDMTRRRPAGA